MLGYWERDEATAETLRDGELHTGDVGFVDHDGYLHVRDRKSLVIIRGGANVYPAEVERVLQEFDGVVASAVVGVADERLGERVVALVQGDVDDRQVARHCEANLAKYKVPERFVFVDAFPRNAMNKIIRKELPTCSDCVLSSLRRLDRRRSTQKELEAVDALGGGGEQLVAGGVVEVGGRRRRTW